MVMKKLLAQIIVLAGISTALFSSCSRKHEVVTVDPALKTAFLFREGSYWIYRDTVNGTVDSVVVKRVDSSYVSEGDYPSDHVQTIDMNYSIYRRQGGKYVYNSERVSGFRKNSVENFIYPFSSGGNSIVTVLANTTILGNSIKDVIQIAHAGIDTYLVKEHVGAVFVRRHLSDSQNYFYGLERWHVVQ